MGHVSIANGFPLISQLWAATNDGQPSYNRLNLCGPTCEAMIERYLYGPGPVLVSPDTINDRIFNQPNEANDLGYTNVSQLSHDLATHNIPNHYAQVDADTALNVFRDNLAHGRPNITLFYADLANLTGGHFCPTVTVDDDAGQAARANPWEDAFDTWSLDTYRRAYNGWFLQVDCNPQTVAPLAGQTSGASSGSPGAPGGATAGPLRFRVLFDGALHAKPNQAAPITQHIKKGDVLMAQAGDSQPWISLKLPNGKWGGWDRRDNITRLP